MTDTESWLARSKLVRNDFSSSCNTNVLWVGVVENVVTRKGGNSFRCITIGLGDLQQSPNIGGSRHIFQYWPVSISITIRAWLKKRNNDQNYVYWPDGAEPCDNQGNSVLSRKLYEHSQWNAQNLKKKFLIAHIEESAHCSYMLNDLLLGHESLWIDFDRAEIYLLFKLKACKLYC